MVLGKFLPPHKGHEYLVQFAANYVDELTVVVGTLQSEPIPGEMRYAWMKELFPHVNVVHLTDENPQYPEEHEDFWNIWKNSLNRVMPWSPDYVFASEDYGNKLAEVLEAEFIACDPGRNIMPVSGTTVRDEPYVNWQYLTDPARSWYLKKVCIVGPESVGKSTLTRNLAQHFNTTFVPEYARTYLKIQDGQLGYEDMAVIARGQFSSEKALEKYANKLLFADTDLVTTTIWSEFLYQKCDDSIYQMAKDSDYDLYLLLDVDVPWVEDIVRYLPENRSDFFDKIEHKLQELGRDYVVISGDWKQRFSDAVYAVNKLFEGKCYE